MIWICRRLFMWAQEISSAFRRSCLVRAQGAYWHRAGRHRVCRGNGDYGRVSRLSIPVAPTRTSLKIAIASFSRRRGSRERRRLHPDDRGAK
jgi:hypothetical protein